MKLSGLASAVLEALGKGSSLTPGGERRSEPRSDFLGRKILIRQRKALGIMHLRNLSHGGACGITDMPLAIGSLVFIEFRRPHFHAARVVWASNLRIGLALVRPLRPEVMDRLQSDHLAATEAA